MKNALEVVATILLGAAVILAAPAMLFLLAVRGNVIDLGLGVGLLLYGSFLWTYVRQELKADWNGAKYHAFAVQSMNRK